MTALARVTSPLLTDTKALPENDFIKELRDSGSLNGTYVNRQHVEQAALRRGDEVQIGKYRMTYHPGPVAGAAAQ